MNEKHINSGYAIGQLAKALTAQDNAISIRDRINAKKRIAQWEQIIKNTLNDMAYGSRTPADMPTWATLAVAKGGFATGELLAGGDLMAHEEDLLVRFEVDSRNIHQARAQLNHYFISEQGLAELQARLKDGCYEINVPEEGALLVVAWLTENGHAQTARHLLDIISPYFNCLRFYPRFTNTPQNVGARVSLENVGQTREKLYDTNEQQRIATQKRCVLVWLPLYDKMIALFFDTRVSGRVCQYFADDWIPRAKALLEELEKLKKTHKLSGKMARSNSHQGQIRHFLRKCVRPSDRLSDKDVVRIQHIVDCYEKKRDVPKSPTCQLLRQQQLDDVSAPLFSDVAMVVANRLVACAQHRGLDDLTSMTAPVRENESARVLEGTEIPSAIAKRLARCQLDEVDALIANGLISSSELLASVLPQITADIRALGITDVTLRQLYASIYRAFRSRRSLLLLNLEKQVQLEELPWISAIDAFRKDNLPAKWVAHQTLETVVVQALTAFPQTIFPNKLIQEIRALCKSAKINAPLTEELAVDIFMGHFSEKFDRAVYEASAYSNGSNSLYARYYNIDYEAIESRLGHQNRTRQGIRKTLADICATRANVQLGGWSTVANGKIIEQQQILTTHNLASLFMALNLQTVLSGQLDVLAKRCFSWILAEYGKSTGDYHADLLVRKNCAYAWRQMVFFVSHLSESEQEDFVNWAESMTVHGSQLRIWVGGLRLAVEGIALGSAQRHVGPFWVGWG